MRHLIGYSAFQQGFVLTFAYDTLSRVMTEPATEKATDLMIDRTYPYAIYSCLLPANEIYHQLQEDV